MPNGEIILVILTMAIVTFSLRALPFYVLRAYKNSEFIAYLGNLMPAYVVFILVIYSYKELDFLNYPYGAPEILAGVFVAILHLYYKNALLSIGGGLLCFFFLNNIVFIPS